MKYPGSVSKDLPPLPNSVIDSSGLHDYPGNNNCVTNTQQEQPTDYHWPPVTHKDNPVTLIPDQWVKSLLGMETKKGWPINKVECSMSDFS